MKSRSIKLLEEASLVLENLNGTLDRARDSAEEFHDQAEALQGEVSLAARRAVDLAKLMNGEPQIYNTWDHPSWR